jgi:hypothetical protein
MDQSKIDLQPDEVAGIASFLGYGRPEADVWFIGLEEGLGKSTDNEACENLKRRSHFETVMDLHEAHLNLVEDQNQIDIEARTSFTQVWLFMAKIMLARNGYNDWSDNKANRASILNEAKKYVRFSLGRKNGQTFLTELSPIPTRRNNDMSWMSEFKKRDQKLDKRIEDRNDQLRELLKANNHTSVICYGKRAADFEKLLDAKWTPVTCEISKSHDGRCLLLPFFGNGQMSHAVIRTLLDRRLL